MVFWGEILLLFNGIIVLMGGILLVFNPRLLVRLNEKILHTSVKEGESDKRVIQYYADDQILSKRILFGIILILLSLYMLFTVIRII